MTKPKDGALTASRLRDLLHYDPETGIFSRLIALSPRSKINGTAGWLRASTGYWNVRVDGIEYKAHRLAWLYIYGQWPSGQIDHINGEKADNRIVNLRVVTGTQNMANARKPRTNKSGLKGASWNAAAQKWAAQIKADGRVRHLGFYDTAEDAHEAYRTAAIKHHGEFARFD